MTERQRSIITTALTNAGLATDDANIAMIASAVTALHGGNEQLTRQKISAVEIAIRNFAYDALDTTGLNFSA